ncbi:MAG: FtsH protease activity modulator HflK [Candidatus Tantalella remota]|nr:FtsH protease activity modulator HflK [Candidatus Tantalella remota]
MDDFRSPDDLFKEEVRKVKKIGKEYGGYLPLVVVGLALILVLQGSLYSVATDEVGIIQRFGEYVRTTDPGLHLKIPFGIEKMTPVKVKKIFKEEFGFRTAQAGVMSVYAAKNFPEESLMLTGDLNILDVRWIVQYRVSNPLALLFKTRKPVDNVRDMSEVVMRRLVGDYTVDEVLTTKREEIDTMAQRDLQVLMDKFQTGVTIITVKLLDVNPPDPVKPAFNEVNEARQQREQMINQAWEAYNKAIPKAEGEAKRTIHQAEGYKVDRVNSAQGEASKFIKTWDEYVKAPDVTKRRLYLETMSNVLPKAKAKYIVDNEQKSILPFLRLGEEGSDAK